MKKININNIIYEEIKKDYLQGVSLKRLENKYNISRSVIYNRLKEDDKINLSNRNKTRYFNFEIEPYITIKKLYLDDKLSMKQISNKTGVGIGKIQHFLEKNSLTRNNLKSKKILSSQNIENSDYFYKIDAEEKAYWLGFIMADGNISKDGYRLKIELNQKDKSHLERFSHIFNSSVKECERYDKRTCKKYYSVFVSVNNKYLIDGLKKQGVTPKKSYTLDKEIFKNIPNLLQRHFIRGYFDGDGSTNGRSITMISCSKGFLEKIGNLMNLELCLSQYTIYEKENYSTISWYGKDNVNKIKNYFYDNSSIYLQRKLDIILEIQNIVNKKDIWKAEEIDLLKTLTKKDFKDKNYIKNIFQNRTFEAVYRKYRRII